MGICTVDISVIKTPCHHKMISAQWSVVLYSDCFLKVKNCCLGQQKKKKSNRQSNQTI